MTTKTTKTKGHNVPSKGPSKTGSNPVSAKNAVVRVAAKKVVAPPTARPVASSTDKRLAKAKAAGVPISLPTLVEPVRGSKQARLIAMLRASPGATIDQMMTLTGWQAHTVRGTISGVLRKKLGLAVSCDGQTKTGERCYRIVASAPGA